MSLITLGLLVDRLDDNHSNFLAYAFREEIASRGLRGICFVGHELTENRKDPCNLAYELASPRALDGLIVGTLGSSYSVEAEIAFLERYNGIPRCTYSISLPGVPRVSVDHTAGMKAAVAHLVRKHRHQRIAFIRGPRTSLDAELRYEGYCDALQEAGLAIDEILVAQGAFTAESGRQAIGVLLDERKLGFDALVAANDAMAAGALQAMVDRGLRVPRDVAVVGFDDVEDSRFARPPMSSVRHPWRAQAMLALDLILAQLAGKEVTESPAVASDFVPRGSCGCGLSSGAELTVRDSMIPSVVEESDWLSGWAFTLLRNLGSRHIELDQAVAGQLVVSFWGRVGGGQEQFLSLLEQELSLGLSQPASLAAWYVGLAQLRENVLTRIGSREALRNAAHELTHAAFQRISYAAERQQALRRFRVEQQGRWLALAGERTINAFEPERVALALREPLAGMGIASCFVARFTEEGKHADSSVQLVIACETNRDYLKVVNDPFPAAEILPRNVWPQRVGCVLVLEILQFCGVVLGYALLELGPRQGTVYRGLAERLAAALKGADLAEEAAEQAGERQRQEYLRMEGELRIAREVQRWILPSSIQSAGTNIAAELISGHGQRAAYYDVLNAGDVTWLCVGLVTGAVGNSGLMLPVVQSVVASVCAHAAVNTAETAHHRSQAVLRDPRRPQSRAIDEVFLLIARYTQGGQLEVAGDWSGAFLVTGQGELVVLSTRESSDEESAPLSTQCKLCPTDTLILGTQPLEAWLKLLIDDGAWEGARSSQEFLQGVLALSQSGCSGGGDASIVVFQMAAKASEVQQQGV